MSHRPGVPSSPSPSSQSTSAPLGVKLICILGVLGTVVFIPTVISLLQTNMGLALFLGGLMLGNLIIVWGLWNLKPWAWMWSVVLYGFGFVIDILSINVLGLVIHTPILLYLISKKNSFENF